MILRTMKGASSSEIYLLDRRIRSKNEKRRRRIGPAFDFGREKLCGLAGQAAESEIEKPI